MEDQQIQDSGFKYENMNPDAQYGDPSQPTTVEPLMPEGNDAPPWDEDSPASGSPDQESLTVDSRPVKKSKKNKEDTQVSGNEPPVKEGPGPDLVTKGTCTEYVRHFLTDEEKVSMAASIARAIADLTSAEADLTAVKAEFKTRITNLKNEISELTKKINAGNIMVPVKCKIQFDYATREVSYIRKDTNEVVRTRTMSADELQRPLDIPI